MSNFCCLPGIAGGLPLFIYGLIFRPKRHILRLGPDSLAVLLLYALGIAGLVFVAQGAAPS